LCCILFPQNFINALKLNILNKSCTILVPTRKFSYFCKKMFQQVYCFICDVYFVSMFSKERKFSGKEIPKKGLSEHNFCACFTMDFTLGSWYKIKMRKILISVWKCSHCLTSQDCKLTDGSSHWFSENWAQSSLLFIDYIIILYNHLKVCFNMKYCQGLQ